MTDIRIVCSHDALKAAETLRRLLEAEEHSVAISYGRQSLRALAHPPKQELALLIWSYEAPTAQYMLDWAMQFDPTRLIEIGCVAGWPDLPRRTPVIDFTKWTGERGGRAWSALTERVRAFVRANQPVKPPPRRAALTLALVSIAAVIGALLIRVHDVFRGVTRPPEPQSIALEIAPAPGDGVGGPLEAVEPPSVDDLYAPMPAPPPIHAHALAATPLADLSVPDLSPDADLRAPTLIERLADFNPLRGADASPPPTP